MMQKKEIKKLDNKLCTGGRWRVVPGWRVVNNLIKSVDENKVVLSPRKRTKPFLRFWPGPKMKKRNFKGKRILLLSIYLSIYLSIFNIRRKRDRYEIVLISACLSACVSDYFLTYFGAIFCTLQCWFNS